MPSFQPVFPGYFVIDWFARLAPTLGSFIPEKHKTTSYTPILKTGLNIMSSTGRRHAQFHQLVFSKNLVNLAFSS